MRRGASRLPQLSAMLEDPNLNDPNSGTQTSKTLSSRAFTTWHSARSPVIRLANATGQQPHR